MTAAAAGTTNPGLSPREGRPDNGAAAAHIGQLFAAHGRMVLGLCRLLLRDPVDAEDAAQQVFVSAQSALVGGAAVREPAAWLVTIARNECRARIRARMREPLELPELPADIPDPLAAAIHTADLDALWAALSALPRRQRNAFLLRELGGLSYGELGAALGVTRPAVESLLFRARQQLRTVLRTMNTALLPIALRDQLVRFLPTGTPTTGAPFAAKLTAVTVGVGLGAVGAVELPARHSHHAGNPVPAVVPVRAPPESHSAPPAPALAAARSSREGRSGEESNVEQRADDRGTQVEKRNEPEHEARVETPQVAPPEQADVEPTEQERSAPALADEGGNPGDGSSGDSEGVSSEGGSGSGSNGGDGLSEQGG